MDIKKAQEFVAKNYTATDEDYFMKQFIPNEHRQNFDISHSGKHSAKLSGKLSGLCEDFDHTGNMDVEKVKKLIPKMLVNILVLCNRLGLDAETELDKMSQLDI